MKRGTPNWNWFNVNELRMRIGFAVVNSLFLCFQQNVRGTINNIVRIANDVFIMNLNKFKIEFIFGQSHWSNG